MAFVVKRCAIIVKGEQHDELHPALHQFDHAAAHRLAVAAFFEIGDEGIATVIVDEVPDDAVDSAQEASDGCPVSAIALD